jgi:hypothetical protein
VSSNIFHKNLFAFKSEKFTEMKKKYFFTALKFDRNRHMKFGCVCRMCMDNFSMSVMENRR